MVFDQKFTLVGQGVEKLSAPFPFCLPFIAGQKLKIRALLTISAVYWLYIRFHWLLYAQELLWLLTFRDDYWLFKKTSPTRPVCGFALTSWLFPDIFWLFFPLYWLSRGLFSNFSPFLQFFTRLSSAPLWSSSAPSVRSWSSLAPFAWVFQFIYFFALPPSTCGFVSDVGVCKRLFYPSLVRLSLFGAGPCVPVGLYVNWFFSHFRQNARKPRKPKKPILFNFSTAPTLLEHTVRRLAVCLSTYSLLGHILKRNRAKWYFHAFLRFYGHFIADSPLKWTRIFTL